MGVLHIFNGISEKSKQTYNFNGKLKNFFLDNKQIDFSHSVILKDGYQIDGNYEVTENDIIYLRKTPSAGTTAGIVAVVALVVAVTAGAVAVGVSIYQQREAQEALEKAEKASKAAQEQSNKLPFVKGARNQAATAQSFPFAIGQSLMTPYRLCPAHYTIAGERGETQYYNAVLEIAYNNIVINKVKMGETVIKDFGDTTTPQNGQFAFDSGTYYDSRNLIEIRNTGAFIDDAFNKKIVMQELGNEIPHDHGDAEKWKIGLVQDLASNPMKAELIILFDGLQEYSGDSWKKRLVKLSPQWTNVNNPTESDWIDFDDGFNQNGTFSNDFEYNTRNQMRFVATQEFTPAQAFGKNIKVRIRRMNAKADSNSKENVYLLAVQTHCYDAKKSSSSSLVAADVLEQNERDKCCRVGVRIAANANTDGQLDAISVIETACARTWNGSEWSSAKTPTRNLAAWALELLTSAHHKPSQYEDEEIDLDSFGEWYEYCEQEHFYADGVITKATKKETILNTLCQNSNATLVKNPFSGLIECYLDNGRDYSVAHLNSENIISISTAKELKRKTDGKKVKYINGAEDYAVDTVTFTRDGGDYNPQLDTLTELSLEYVTSYEHAFKIAWRKMAEEIAQPRVITVKVGYEAAYYPLYSRIDLQHKSLSNGLAHGVIKSLVYELGILKKIILEGVVTFPQDVACGVIINCVSDTEHGVLCLKVSGSGKTNELTVENYTGSLAVTPAVGNILSFGELDDDGEFTLVASPMKITNAEENDNGFTLTLVDYNEDLYTYGTLPAYKSNITYKPDDASITIEEQRPVMQTSDAEALVSGAAQAACDEIIKGTHFNSVYKITPSPLSLEEIIAKLDNDTQNASASISMSHDEILLQVENTEKGLRGLIDIQAGSVQALVEGGGTSGQMALSINLPAVINADARTRLINASTLEKVNAVYALIDRTANYGIKGNVTDAQLKALWSDACDAGLLASQIELQADKIYIGGDVIVNTANKIKAALIDVENLIAEKVEIKNGGYIKSENYDASDPDTSGVYIDTNGNAVFKGLTQMKGAILENSIDLVSFNNRFVGEFSSNISQYGTTQKALAFSQLLEFFEFFENYIPNFEMNKHYFVNGNLSGQYNVNSNSYLFSTTQFDFICRNDNESGLKTYRIDAKGSKSYLDANEDSYRILTSFWVQYKELNEDAEIEIVFSSPWESIQFSIRKSSGYDNRGISVEVTF